ncbi:MAG: hypothetical protein J6V12_00575 [Bacteroidaceae bacterium]|nr:hypothetical protein [Bacteroidaceae bacterium]
MLFDQFCNEICDRVEERILTSYRPIDFREALYLLDVVDTPSYYDEKYMLGIKVEMTAMPIIPLVANNILRGRYDAGTKAIKRDEYALNNLYSQELSGDIKGCYRNRLHQEVG